MHAAQLKVTPHTNQQRGANYPRVNAELRNRNPPPLKFDMRARRHSDTLADLNTFITIFRNPAYRQRRNNQYLAVGVYVRHSSKVGHLDRVVVADKNVGSSQVTVDEVLTAAVDRRDRQTEGHVNGRKDTGPVTAYNTHGANSVYCQSDHTVSHHHT